MLTQIPQVFPDLITALKAANKELSLYGKEVYSEAINGNVVSKATEVIINYYEGITFKTQKVNKENFEALQLQALASTLKGKVISSSKDICDNKMESIVEANGTVQVAQCSISKVGELYLIDMDVLKFGIRGSFKIKLYENCKLSEMENRIKSLFKTL